MFHVIHNETVIVRNKRSKAITVDAYQFQGQVQRYVIEAGAEREVPKRDAAAFDHLEGVEVEPVPTTEQAAAAAPAEQPARKAR